MDSRSKKRPGAYVTEGMLSHLRQHIRGSKKAITIACSLADVRDGDRGLDQARVAVVAGKRHEKCSAAMEAEKKIFGFLPKVREKFAANFPRTEQLFYRRAATADMHEFASAGNGNTRLLAVRSEAVERRIGEKDARLLLLGQRVRAASNIVDGPLVGDGQRKRRLQHRDATWAQPGHRVRERFKSQQSCRAEAAMLCPPKIRGEFLADNTAVVIEEAPLRAVDGGSLGDAAMEDDKKHLGGKRRDVLAGMRGRDAEEGGSLLEDVLRAMRRLAHDGAVADDRLCKNQAMAERSRFGIRGVAEDLA